MTEPDVALTDYGVAIECALLVWLICANGARGELRHRFAILFASAGVSALAGGTVHGFFAGEDSLAGTALWRIVLLALGLAAFAAWSIGARLMFAGRTARRIEILAGAEFVAYAVIVLAVDQRFWIALANYAPSTVFLGASFLVAFRRKPAPSILMGLGGMVLTMVAAIVQKRQIALHAAYFNHNALYHLIQMIAFVMIFLAGRHFNASSSTVR